MVCSARPARCGPFPLTSGVAPLSDVLAALIIGSAAGLVIIFGLGIAGVIPTGGATGAAASAGALGGIIAGLVVYFVLMGIIIATWADRCRSSGKTPIVCATGVVSDIVENDSPSFGERLFPFTRMHDRVDVVTQSRSWPDIESGGAVVWCTPDRAPRTSEILRCYFFDPQLCAEGVGAIIGGATLGGVGVVAGIAAAAAIGCASIILCILAVVLAILLVAVFVLSGAMIGSAIGHAVSDDSSPSSFITLGDFVGVAGNIQQRGFDSDANVLWFALEIGLGGTTRSRTHCDLDEMMNLCRE